MKDSKNENNNKLNSLLSKYDNFVNRKKEKAKQERNERENFMDQFIKIRDKIIEPVFIHIKDQIESKGHKVNIIKKDSSWDDEKNIPIEPSISFNLKLYTTNEKYLSRYHDTSRDLPHIMFICDSNKKIIWSHESTIGPGHGGHSSSRNTFTAEQINKEIAKKELMEWIEILMKEIIH